MWSQHVKPFIVWKPLDLIFVYISKPFIVKIFIYIYVKPFGSHLEAILASKLDFIFVYILASKPFGSHLEAIWKPFGSHLEAILEAIYICEVFLGSRKKVVYYSKNTAVFKNTKKVESFVY